MKKLGSKAGLESFVGRRSGREVWEEVWRASKFSEKSGVKN